MKKKQAKKSARAKRQDRNSVVLGVGHRCPELKGDQWSEFALLDDESDGGLFVYECPDCKQRACVDWDIVAP